MVLECRGEETHGGGGADESRQRDGQDVSVQREASHSPILRG
jgi:hypothetical protein